MEENEDVLKLRSEAIEEAKKRGVSGEFLKFLKHANLDRFADEIRSKVNYKLSVSGEQAHVLLLQTIRECFVTMPITKKRQNAQKYLLDRWESRKTRKDEQLEELEIYEIPIEDCTNRRIRKENEILDKSLTYCGICMKKGMKFIFSNAGQIIAHMEKKHGNVTLFACSFCSKSYTTKDGYEKHECAQYDAFREKRRLKNSAYRTEFLFALCGLICTDCGKMHSLKTNIANELMQAQRNTMNHFFRNHNSSEMVLIQFVSENEIVDLPNIQILSSLNANMQMNCSECKIESFTSVEKKREHFALVHSASSTLSCPHDSCDIKHTDEVQLKKHILEEHISNGMMGFFMNHHAAVHVGKPDNVVGYVSPCVVTGKKPQKEHFFVGGMNTKDFSYRLPPKTIETFTKYINPVNETLVNTLKIPPSLIDMDRNEAGLKISTRMFTASRKPMKFGKMSLTNVINGDTLKKMTIDMDSIRDCEIEIPLEDCDEKSKKNIRKMLGYCMECHRILNGQKCIEAHGTRSCNFEKIRILSKNPTYQNKTLVCPTCDETVCSIDGLIFHVFDVHGKFCNYDCDENESVKTIVISEETRRVNRLIGLDEIGVNKDDQLNALVPRESYLGTLLAENKAKKRKPSYDPICETPVKRNTSDNSDPTHNQPSTSTPASLSPVEEELAQQDSQFVTIRKQRAIDVAAMWSESGLNGNDVEEPPENSDSSAVDDRTTSDNNAVINTTEDTTRSSSCNQSPPQLVDQVIPDVRETETTKPAIIRVEPIDNTPNVEYNHQIETDEQNEMNDDEIVFVEMTRGKVQHEGMSKDDNRPAVVPQEEVFEEDGDDECMAVAQITNPKGVETTKSRRNATFSCPKCSLKFMTKTNLEYHYKAQHEQDTIDDLVETDYGLPLHHPVHLCLRCSTAFQTLEAFEKHSMKHIIHAKKRLCDFCPGILCDGETNHTHDSSFVCGSCEPQQSFESESQLLYHLANHHQVQMIYYCKKCFIGYCSPDHVFYDHLIHCFPDYSRKKLPEIFGIMAASTWSYQPDDEEQHKRLLAANPEQYTYVSECSHRSAYRMGKSFYTCPDESCDKKFTCFVLINNFRFITMREILKKPINTQQNTGTQEIHGIVWESWIKSKMAQRQITRRLNQKPSSLPSQPQANNNLPSPIMPNLRRMQKPQQRQQIAPVVPNESSNILTQMISEPVPSHSRTDLVHSQSMQRNRQPPRPPVVSNQPQSMQVDQRQQPPVQSQQQLHQRRPREIQQHHVLPLTPIQPPSASQNHFSPIHNQPRGQQLPQLPPAMRNQLSFVPSPIERSLAPQSHISAQGNANLYLKTIEEGFNSLPPTLQLELRKCWSDLKNFRFPFADNWYKSILHLRISISPLKQFVNSPAHQRFLHLLFLTNGGVCIFCGNEHAEGLRRFPIDVANALIERLAFCYHTEMSILQRQLMFTAHDIRSVLHLRLCFVKCNDADQQTIAICENHCVGQSSNVEAQVFQNLPEAFFPKHPQLMLKPPLFEQLQARANNLNYRNNYMLNKTAEMISKVCSVPFLPTNENPIIVTPQQLPCVPQIQFQQMAMAMSVTSQQQELRHQQEVRQPLTGKENPRTVERFAMTQKEQEHLRNQQMLMHFVNNVKACDFCRLNKNPIQLDKRLLINLSDPIPSGWIRAMKNQLTDKPQAVQQEYIRVLCDKNSLFCIRHFVPQAFDIIDNELVFNGNVQNWPLIDIVQEVNIQQGLKEKLDSFLQLMGEGTHGSRLSECLIDLQKQNTCPQPNCSADLKTSQEFEIHKMHHNEKDVTFCCQCMTTFSGNADEDILRHLKTVHKVKDENVQRKLRCATISACPEKNKVFTSMFEFRFHLSKKHKDVFQHASVCGLGFAAAEYCDQHDTMHSDAGTMECCAMCARVGSQKMLIDDEMMSHELVHGFDRRSFCKLCGQYISDSQCYGLYRQHFIREHMTENMCNVCQIVADEAHIEKHQIIVIRQFDKIIDTTENNSFKLVVTNRIPNV